MLRDIINNLRIDSEARPGATVAGSSVSKLYDMTGWDQALFVAAIGPRATNSSIATCATVVFELVESSAASAAGTTLIGGKATIAIGAASNTAIGTAAGCNAIILQSGSAASATAATTGDIFQFGLGTDIVTFTFSSAATMTSPTAGKLKATVAYFGSSIAASTADTGGTALIDSIRTALQSKLLCIGGPDIYKFSTPDTASLMIEVANGKGPIYYNNTMATTRMIGQCAGAALAIPIKAEQLTATANKKLVGLRWSTLNEAAGLGITCIRSRGRYMPGGFAGKIST
jgi:hypothetical protein